MLTTSEKLKKRRFKDVIYYIASLVMPSILLFDLYNRNHTDSVLHFDHIVILAGILAVVGLVMFIVLKFIVGSVYGALLLSLALWLIFWLFEASLGVIRNTLGLNVRQRYFILLLLVVSVLLIYVVRRYKPPFEKIRPVFNVLAFCLVVMFLFNLIPGINHEITLARARAQMSSQDENEEEPFYTKRNFNVDSTLPSPDIYWFHVDGLMSLETVEKFWDFCGEDIREEVRERGFVIYEDATLNAGFTRLALSALFSPTLYDNFLEEHLLELEMEAMLRRGRTTAFAEQLAEYGLTYLEDIIPSFELFNAFTAKGYRFDLCRRRFQIFEVEEMGEATSWQRFHRGDLPRLLSMTTPLPRRLFSILADENVGGASLEGGIGGDPRFVQRFIWRANMGNMEYRLEPESVVEGEGSNVTRIDLYPQGVEDAFYAVLDWADVFIERNPNAVVVIQSDHGFHLQATQEHLLEQGYSVEEVMELMFSVFSAVRIPDAYGGLEEPIAPLNITRELVNRFVGENYELLDSE